MLLDKATPQIPKSQHNFLRIRQSDSGNVGGSFDGIILDSRRSSFSLSRTLSIS